MVAGNLSVFSTDFCRWHCHSRWWHCDPCGRNCHLKKQFRGLWHLILAGLHLYMMDFLMVEMMGHLLHTEHTLYQWLWWMWLAIFGEMLPSNFCHQGHSRRWHRHTSWTAYSSGRCHCLSKWVNESGPQSGNLFFDWTWNMATIQLLVLILSSTSIT